MNATEMIAVTEQDLIGSVLQKPALLASIELSPSHFQTKRWGTAWTVLQAMNAASEPVDIITLTEALMRENGWNGWFKSLGEAVSGCSTPSMAEERAKRIREASLERIATETANELIANIRSQGLSAVDAAVQKLLGISIPSHRHECGIREAVKDALEVIQTALNADGIPGVTTGLGDLDGLLGGFQNSDLYIVAARPAMGKTAFGLNLSVSAALAGVPVGVVSAEQPRDQIAMRMMAIRGDLPLAKMRSANLSEGEWSRVTQASVSLTNIAPIRINDRPAMSIADIQRQARAWKHEYNIGFLLVDYVQRIRASSASQSAPAHERVGEVVMGLKEIARELQIPVVALAQINRGVEARADKRPNMGDIKDSGTIEQEADCIMTLYRDEVYDPDTKDKGRIEINIEKNRHGPTGGVLAHWRASALRVLPLAKDREDST